ncbi:MAG: DNA-binding response regulator [Verrucomicrobiales bacterium]|nr:DNA-binding response regulator [Verrucomicrobiales bacterium]
MSNNALRHILLVDDDVGLLELNEEVLSASGYQVTTAADGALAWEALQGFGFDLLITDNNMPNTTGLELLEKMFDAGIATPVIMATGTYPEEAIAAKPWLEPSAVLSKPYTMHQLLAAVENVLAGADQKCEGLLSEVAQEK